MFTVAISGASGFLGSNLTRFLIEKKVFVRPILRENSSNISNGIFIKDLRDESEWPKKLGGVDCIVHAAGRAHILNEKSSDPLKLFREINVDATLSFAKGAINSKVKRFIFISSVGVNGCETHEAPFTEIMKPNPCTPYAISKCEAEVKLKELCACSAMELVIVRPPMIYGKDAPGNFGLLSSLIKKDYILPVGSAKFNRRSLVGIDNLIDFIYICLRHEKAANEVFLISDGECISTVELVSKMSNALGKSPKVWFIPDFLLKAGLTVSGRKSTYQSLFGSLEIDASKAKKYLGWMPPVSVNDGLSRAMK